MANKKKNTKSTTSTKSKTFRVDPVALLKQNPKQVQEFIDDLNEMKVIKRSQLYRFGQRLALRLAMLKVIAVDTLERDAEERTYRLKGRLTMTVVKAALAKAQ